MNLIYSRTKVQGAAYRPDIRVLNPRFFTEASANAAKVFVAGDYPDIRAAYEAKGVPVEAFTTVGAIPVLAQPAKAKK
jgi:hypothetical protein